MDGIQDWIHTWQDANRCRKSCATGAGWLGGRLWLVDALGGVMGSLQLFAMQYFVLMSICSCNVLLKCSFNRILSLRIVQSIVGVVLNFYTIKDLALGDGFSGLV